MTARRRVAVPEALFHTETNNGRGRMWHEVLSRLAGPCDLLTVRGGFVDRVSRRRRPPEAWLFDGHAGPMDVREPQVIQLHEAPWNEPETMETLDAVFLEMVVEPSRRAARAAAAVVCPSDSAKQQIVTDTGIPADKVFVAHHGVDHATFRPGLTGGGEVAVSFGAAPGVPYILTVASLHPRKNLHALRDAVAQLAGEGFPHQLLIVGAPSWGRPDAADLAASFGAELPGAPGRLITVPFGISDGDIAALMSAAAVFCLPSLAEGFGLPAAEAMACGTPTVLSNRGALPEIGHDAAVFVEPSSEAIAAGLRSLLVDPDAAKNVGFACAERAREFTWDRCAERWLVAIEAGVTAGVPA